MSGIRLSTYHTGTMKDIQDVFALVKMKIVSYPCNLYPKKIPKRAKIFQGKFKMKRLMIESRIELLVPVKMISSRYTSRKM